MSSVGFPLCPHGDCWRTAWASSEARRHCLLASRFAAELRKGFVKLTSTTSHQQYINTQSMQKRCERCQYLSQQQAGRACARIRPAPVGALRHPGTLSVRPWPRPAPPAWGRGPAPCCPGRGDPCHPAWPPWFAQRRRRRRGCLPARGGRPPCSCPSPCLCCGGHRGRWPRACRHRPPWSDRCRRPWCHRPSASRGGGPAAQPLPRWRCGCGRASDRHRRPSPAHCSQETRLRTHSISFRSRH